MLSDSELIMRLVLAALLGGAIGFERERQSWAAGLRTHMLVSVGSCLIMIVSAFGFQDIINNPHVSLDPSRIAAQVVSGIGFLGAGAILLRGEVVRGLTTAASLWAVSGIGLAVGGGLYIASGATTIICLIILAGMKPIEEKYKDMRHSCVLHLQARRGHMTLELLQEVMGDKASRIKQFVVQPAKTYDQDDVTIRLSRIPPKDVTAVIERLQALPVVSDVRKDSN